MNTYKDLFIGSVFIISFLVGVMILQEVEYDQLKRKYNKVVDTANAWKDRSQDYQKALVKEKIKNLDTRAKLFHLEEKLKRLNAPQRVEIPLNVT